ncbi:MAG: AMP-binding protein [Verrucomicrobiota bacterium]|nr:AMP-binding protein [Verrucomicrobiota bacterium]
MPEQNLFPEPNLNTDAAKFLVARETLLNAASYEEACETFRWPDLTHFNWALDYFDPMARDNEHTALIWVDQTDAEKRVSFNCLRSRSNQVANFLQDLCLEKGDVVMALMHNTIPLFELLLAAMKVSAVVTPGSILLTTEDIADRIRRGGIKAIVADESMLDRIEQCGDLLATVKIKIVIGQNARRGWVPFEKAYGFSDAFKPAFPTYVTDPCLLYFTSGTTAQPKIVLHTHASYPVGHLVTMYWLGLHEGDIHYNISAPGWGKHAWSSFFAPWNAGATILVFHYDRFPAKQALQIIERYKVTSLCAPPTVWRRFLIEDLTTYKFSLRSLVSAGEPLNPEIIERVAQVTGVKIREGYGQTETVLQIGTFPGMAVKPGAMGRAAPGFKVSIVGPSLHPITAGQEGQIALRVSPERPLGLMKGYRCDRRRDDEVFIGGWYLTSDVALCDADGYYWFIGRNDDVFKCSDYRISPFEVESELLKHPAVAEAAVIGSMDDVRDGLVPKAFIALRPGNEPTPELAVDIFRFCRNAMAPYKRPRRIEFMSELCKTVSGKIKRVELRNYDDNLRRLKKRGELEFQESDFGQRFGRPAPIQNH